MNDIRLAARQVPKAPGFGVIACSVARVALLACRVLARRPTRMDPVEALRAE